MQFDVYENKNPASKKRFPYLLDVQAELLDSLDTRVVIPLAPRPLSEGRTLTRLMPVLQIESGEYVAHTPQMAGISRRHLGVNVSNIAQARTDIIAALDFLFTGI